MHKNTSGSYFLCDTHAHLYAEHFNDDIDSVVTRAQNQSISKIYLPNIARETVALMKMLQAKYPDFFEIMLGLHPTEINQNYKDELSAIFNEFDPSKYCAIGEIGIDLYWDKTFLKEQTIVFEHQINIAIQHNLPIVIHARESLPEIFESLSKFQPSELKGIFHSFTGNYEEAKKALSLGDFKLGINGIVTFKKAEVAETIKKIGLEHLLLETDSPYLAPAPHRGKRNESAYLIYIAQKIAELLLVDISTVANSTTKNANHIFGKR